MSWVKAAWIPPLFSAFNTVAPNRSKASDGTIGDTAHQGSKSGHNPDDTPGSKPEREDSDTIAEVRAADVTEDLRSEITMEMVIQRILVTPSERDRLIYIIFNRRIWQKANGWREEHYSGSDPHDTHAHLSGDPASDNDAGPWNSILSVLDEGDDMNSQQEALLANCERILTAFATRLMDDPGPGESADRTAIKLVAPWYQGPTEVPNPIDWLIAQFEELDVASNANIEQLADLIVARLSDQIADAVITKVITKLGAVK